MGGLVGWAASALSGHALGGKAGHSTPGTIIGAVAGAFTSHKARDAAGDWKDERNEKTNFEQQQQQQQQWQHDSAHSTYSQGRIVAPRSRGDLGGNFATSSQEIRIDAHGDYNLHVQCREVNGSYS